MKQNKFFPFLSNLDTRERESLELSTVARRSENCVLIIVLMNHSKFGNKK